VRFEVYTVHLVCIVRAVKLKRYTVYSGCGLVEGLKKYIQDFSGENFSEEATSKMNGIGY
jgi:hypothetical protein